MIENPDQASIRCLRVKIVVLSTGGFDHCKLSESGENHEIIKDKSSRWLIWNFRSSSWIEDTRGGVHLSIIRTMLRFPLTAHRSTELANLNLFVKRNKIAGTKCSVKVLNLKQPYHREFRRIRWSKINGVHAFSSVKFTRLCLFVVFFFLLSYTVPVSAEGGIEHKKQNQVANSL